MFKKILAGKYHFNHKEFEKVSSEGKDLIAKLLKVDPKKRISTCDALKHPWFAKFGTNVSKGSTDDELDPSIVENLKGFRGCSKLKKVALNVFVKMLDAN